MCEEMKSKKWISKNTKVSSEKTRRKRNIRKIRREIELEKGRDGRESERVDRCGLTCLGQRQIIQLCQIHRQPHCDKFVFLKFSILSCRLLSEFQHADLF